MNCYHCQSNEMYFTCENDGHDWIKSQDKDGANG